jgi:hypothetical protein
MLPHSYELPAALLLVLGGALSCLAGYRLFRLVLAVYGFILGAAIASSMMGASNGVGMLVAALVGGVAGALILVLAYFVGIALVGAGLGALVIHVVWGQIGKGDPPWIAVLVLAVVGAIGAMVLQRYVIIVSTAFGGAWTVIVGGLAAAGNRGALRAAQATPSGNPWILYPFTPAPGEAWVPLAWVVLGLIGTAVQLGITGKRKR